MRTDGLWPHVEAVARIRRAVRLAAEGDPAALRLTHECLRSLVAARFSENRPIIETVEARSYVTGPRLHFLVVLPEDLGLLPYQPPAPVCFDGANLLFVQRGLWREWYLGAVVLREMSRWNDVSRIAVRDMAQQWLRRSQLMREISLRQVELAALNRLTHGLWSERCHALAAASSSVCLSSNQLWQPSQTDIDSLLAVLPDEAGCPDELAMRCDAARFTYAFAQCQTEEDYCKALCQTRSSPWGEKSPSEIARPSAN